MALACTNHAKKRNEVLIYNIEPDLIEERIAGFNLKGVIHDIDFALQDGNNRIAAGHSDGKVYIFDGDEETKDERLICSLAGHSK